MIYAISDLHLSLNGSKPMEVFGDDWTNYLATVEESWRATVSEDDVVLLAGDLSWEMKLDGAVKDAEWVHVLPGQKVIIRGNHDYWWSSYNKVCSALPSSIHAIQNNAIRLGNAVFCGSRGWMPTPEDGDANDRKLWLRELTRMQLALEDAAKQRKEGDKLIAMVHYPPFVGKFEPTQMTDLFDTFHVDAVVYGHVHGKHSFHRDIVDIHGIKYYLTSTDMVDHHLVKID